MFQIQVTAINPTAQNSQKDLFEGDEDSENSKNKNIALMQAMDAINHRYGAYTISPAQLLHRTHMNDVIAPAWKPQGVRRSV